MPRIYANILDPARRGLLAIALLAGGVMPAPVLADAFTSMARSEVMDSFWDNAHAAMEDLEYRANEDIWIADGGPTSGDESVIYLVASFDDGSIVTGTGTLIKGDDGNNRVLTAGHVVPIDSMSEENPAFVRELLDIQGFSQTGEPIASFDIAISGFKTAAEEKKASLQDVVHDVAVLVPYAFSGHITEESWNELPAARLAAEIPAGLLMGADGIDSMLVSGGISGASVRNQAGEVLGIITHSYGGVSFTEPVVHFDYLQRVAAQSEARHGSDVIDLGTFAITAEMEYHERPERLVGAIAVGAPVLMPKVLQALNVSGVKASEPGSEFEARVMGFPDFEMRSGNLAMFSLANYALPQDLDPDRIHQTLPDPNEKGEPGFDGGM